MSSERPLNEFPLSSWAIDHQMTVFVIIAIVMIGGVFSYMTMSRESFPEIVESKIYISSVFPGNSAEDVEKFITRPLEDEIKDISEVSKITSTSSQDYSLIIIEFEDDVSIENAKTKVKDKVDLAKGKDDWPTLDSGPRVDPYIFDLNISELMPALNINLTGAFSEEELKEFGEILERKIEILTEVKEVNVLGVQEKEIVVAVDFFKMTASNTSIEQIIQAIQKENVTISGGNLINNGTRRNIRVIGQIQKPKELEDIVVKREKGDVFLKDIASIEFREKDRTTYARAYQQPVVMLSVIKKGGKNLIKASKKIHQIVKKAKESFPDHLTISITNDNSEQTNNRISGLENNIILGIILVISVLMFFLGFRNALFVGVAIPLSMLISFILISSIGFTLNVMVLFALVMGLGMLVDNGIVVVENVHRLMSKGMSRMRAAKQGVGEIAWPIIASTATTLAAFVPLGLWPGTMGKFMIYLPLTLSIVLGSSLFVALVINAMLTSAFMEVEEMEIRAISLKRTSIVLSIFGVLLWISGWTGYNEFFLLLAIIGFFIGGLWLYRGWKEKEDVKLLKRGIGIVGLSFVLGMLGFFPIPKVLIGFGTFFVLLAGLFWVYKKILFPTSNKFQYTFLPRLENKYKQFLEFAIRKNNAYRFLFGTIGLLLIAFVLFFLAKPDVLFFPVNQPHQVFVYIEYPEGTDIEKTKILTHEIEKKVIDVIDQYTIQEDGQAYNFMVESVISQVGEGSGNPMIDGGSRGESPQKAKVTVSFREFKYRRGINSKEVMEKIRQAVQGYAGVSILVEKDVAGPPPGYAINIEVEGDNYLQLMRAVSNIRDYINESNIPGIEELKLDVNINKPELEVYVDRKKAGRLGVSTRDVGYGLRQAIYGFDASTFKGERDDYDIFVRFDENNRYNLNNLLMQHITFRDQASGKLLSIPISSVVSTKKTETFSAIKRKNLNRLITIYSNVLEGYNPTKVVQKIKEKLIGYPLPEGMRYQFTGEQEKLAENMSFLTKALMIALALITLIIVAQFNSISKPMIILMAVIFSFIGVLFGLFIFQMDFIVIMTMMGIISLAGIVVNNAIVLIDYTQLLVGRKKKELGITQHDLLSREQYFDAIVRAGISRLRPVLLTAITTIFGLIPLAIGFNIDFFTLFTEFNPNIYIGGDSAIFWGPMSWTIIFGLSFATFLTLIIVPVMLYLLARAKIRFTIKN